MPDLLKEHVKAVLEEELQKKYPYILHPACMYAEVKEVFSNRTCTIQVLTEQKGQDKTYPSLPYVSCQEEVKLGDIVVICFLYGGTTPYILGKESGHV